MNPIPRTLSPSEEMRLFGGVLAQPILAGTLAFVLFPWLLLDRNGRTLAGGFPQNVSDAALSVALGAALIAGAVTVLGVVPAAVWLMKRRQLTLSQTLWCGLAFGNLPYLLMAIAAGGTGVEGITYGVEGLLRGVAFSSLLGVSGAAVFWPTAIRSRRVHTRPAAG